MDTLTPPMTPPRRRSLVLPGVVVVVLAVAVALFFAFRSGTPGDTSPEAGFARDMGVHHAQAVQMAFAIRDRSDDVYVRNLAEDIITTQTAQRGIFMGWLQEWGLDQSSDRPAMAWMAGHGHGVQAVSGVMPGMATKEQVARLDASPKGQAAEILFLQLMIRHHEGGIQMAQGLLKLSDRPEVRTMAQSIVDGQGAEIKQMKDMLAQRGAQPLPSILK
jgi:uncharacterized protein (DUF305 family)